MHVNDISNILSINIIIWYMNVPDVTKLISLFFKLYAVVHYLFTQSYTALGWPNVVETCERVQQMHINAFSCIYVHWLVLISLVDSFQVLSPHFPWSERKTFRIAGITGENRNGKIQNTIFK